jgi:MFS family permease
MADKIGKMKLFIFGSVWSMLLVVIYTHLSVSPLWFLILFNAVLFIGITSRMIASSALTTAVPEPADRGAFMGINSSVAQISGGIASALAGMIVYQTDSGHIERYPVLGFIVAGSMAITMWMMHIINQDILKRSRSKAEPATPGGDEVEWAEAAEIVN